jgi:hypothetical protein
MAKGYGFEIGDAVLAVAVIGAVGGALYLGSKILKPLDTASDVIDDVSTSATNTWDTIVEDVDNVVDAPISTWSAGWGWLTNLFNGGKKYSVELF